MTNNYHNPIDIRQQIGAMIGMGCPECEGYITVKLIKADGYHAVCENCDHEYWIRFDKQALESAAPHLLAACVRLAGTIMRDSTAASIGSPGYKHIQDALTAIAEASGLPHEYWEAVGNEIKKVTQEIRQAPE